MSIARLRHEVRLLGAVNLALPAIVGAIYLGFSVVVYNATLRNTGDASYAHFQAARGLLGLLENGLPLAAGLISAAVVGQDAPIEVLLALPAPYRRIAGLRLALVTTWASLFTGAVSVATATTGYWLLAQFHLQPVPRDQLTWVAPLLWFTAAGAALAVLLRSRAASSAILGMIWIAQFIFKPQFLHDAALQKVYLFLTEEDPTQPYWLTNRLIVLAIAVVLCVATIWLLGRSEALLGAEA